MTMDTCETNGKRASAAWMGKALAHAQAAISGVDRPVPGGDAGQAAHAEHVARVARLAVDTHDPRQLLQHVPRVAAEALCVDHGVVYLLGADRLAFHVAAGVGLPGDRGLGAGEPDRGDLLPGFVAAAGRPAVATASGSRPLLADALACCEGGLSSALAVPLFDRGRVTGVLAVHARRARVFGGADVRFLETLASLLAVSLQRAHGDEALSHSQALKSVGQLTSGIVHDFNNLLTVISGNLQVLEGLPAVAASADLQRGVQAALRAAGRGAELAGKLMEFSRLPALQPVPVNVGALLCPLAGLLGRMLDQRIRITVDVAPDLPACLVDRGQLESALLNLAINARDAMPAGGRLSFSGRAADALPCAVQAGQQGDHPAAVCRGYVAIGIGDTGTGMSQAVRQHALAPFFTTKEPGRGTGLGLSMVASFVAQSQGAMVLDSAPGLGTTVTLFLPPAALR